MINCIIVDDETSARMSLSNMLTQYSPKVEQIGEASTVKEAILLISELRPNLVFLDIEMQDGTGFDVLTALPVIDFQVVFATAHERYALQSFRFAAIDYLLKPIRQVELDRTIQRALAGSKPLIKTGADFDSFQEKAYGNESKSKVILVSESNGFSVVRWEDIVYCEAAKNYTIFTFVDGQKIVAARALGEHEVQLNEFGFLRIHKSFIVNCSKITRYVRGRGGEVTMSNKTILPVARERKQDLLDYFEGRFGIK